MRQIILIANNIRSCYNVGSLLRTAEGLAISKVYLTGYTPYPYSANDQRLPYLALKADRQIHKTALGAEKTMAWENRDNLEELIQELKQLKYFVAALEQKKEKIILPSFKPPPMIALIVGEEVSGLEDKIINQCQATLEIPMFGKKESYNVASAAAMALYHLKFMPFDSTT